MASGGVKRAFRRLRRVSDPVAPRLPAPAPALPTTAVDPPIFVVGCQRSGTSLVRRIVDSHSRIACPPESKFVLPIVQVLRDKRSMRALASMGYERDAFVRSLAAYIDSIFMGYAAAKGKPRWADKTPNYVACLPELWELFGPDARFVLVVRHGLDVAHSLADPRRTYPAINQAVEEVGGDRPKGAARFWRQQNEIIEGFRAEHPDACMRLRYEELTADPETVARSLFAFLGEPWEPAVLHHERFPHDSGIEDPDVRRTKGVERRVGTSRAWPSELRDELVTQELEPMLSTLGYRAEPPT